MAIRATFTADVSQFESAVEQAKTSLRGFELRTDDLGRALGRMSKQFDGSSIIRDANLMATAVDKIGGATKLTENEQKRLNTTLTEALAKYKALGQTAPDSLEKLAAATAHANKQTGLLGSTMATVRGVAAGMVAGFGVERLISGMTQAVGSTIDFADSISDLSDKTGVSTTALQRWSFAAKQTGTDLQTLVNASQELSKRLGEGSDSTVGAVEKLGLNFQKLKALSPEQQLETVASALKGVKDQTDQSSIAADIFGKAWKELIAPVRAGLQEMGDEAERLGAVLDEKTVRSLGQLADTWQKLKDTGTGLIGSVLSPMVPLLNQMAEGAGKLASAFSGADGAFQKLLLLNKILGGSGAGGMMIAAFGNGGPAPAGSAAGIRPVSSHDDNWTPKGGNVINAEEWFIKGLTEAAKAQDLAAKELEASAKYWREWAGQLRNQTGWAVKDIAINQGPTGGWNGGGGYLNTISNITNPWGGVSSPYGMGNALGYNGFKPTTVPGGGNNWSGFGMAGLSTAMPYLSQLIAGGSQSAQIGGSVAGGLGGALGSLSSVTSALGSFAPFLGPIAGIVGGLIGKLFGPSKGAIAGKTADSNIANTQAGLLQQYGSVENIAGMGSAGAALAAAWGSKNVAGEQWFNDLTKAFEQQNALLADQADLQTQISGIEAQRKALQDSLIPTWESVNAIIAKYGVSLEGLGSQVQQLGATTTWTQMINDIETLVRAGGDVGGILVGMQDEMSALVQASMKFGTTIPQNMRFYIEELAKSGRLLDENGNAITDLSTLQWGDKVATQADIINESIGKLNDSMDDLIEKLSTIADKLAGIPSLAGSAGASINGLPSNEDPVALASGGIVRSPTYALIGEAGPEAVIPLSRGRARSSMPTIVQVVLDGRVLAETVLREAPGLAPAYGI
jgi:tetrahydromethanopterin S-methyltransferase subunit B